MSKLDSHFKCPGYLKTLLVGQPKSLRRPMYEAYQNYINFKKKALKRDKTDKVEASA